MNEGFDSVPLKPHEVVTELTRSVPGSLIENLYVFVSPSFADAGETVNATVGVAFVLSMATPVLGGGVNTCVGPGCLPIEAAIASPEIELLISTSCAPISDVEEQRGQYGQPRVPSPAKECPLHPPQLRQESSESRSSFGWFQGITE